MTYNYAQEFADKIDREFDACLAGWAVAPELLPVRAEVMRKARLRDMDVSLSSTLYAVVEMEAARTPLRRTGDLFCNDAVVRLLLRSEHRERALSKVSIPPYIKRQILKLFVSSDAVI